MKKNSNDILVEKFQRLAGIKPINEAKKLSTSEAKAWLDKNTVTHKLYQMTKSEHFIKGEDNDGKPIYILGFNSKLDRDSAYLDLVKEVGINSRIMKKEMGDESRKFKFKINIYI